MNYHYHPNLNHYYRDDHSPSYYYDHNEQRFLPFFPILPIIGGLAGLAGGFALGALAFRPPYCPPYGPFPPYGGGAYPGYPPYGGGGAFPGYPPYGGGAFPGNPQPYPPVNPGAYLPGNAGLNNPGNLGPYPY
ncbi:hypothetical protein [Bacillus sp. AFS002410]|uniref:hypothetical protein n=1 Tax=Bacillus sp. AFS002410 TaxID=2033481 RepID=UPI0026A6A7AB